MSLFTDVASGVAVGIGLGAVGAEVSTRVLSTVTARRALRNTSEDRFGAVIEQADRAKLARYLHDELGSVPVSTYAANADVRRRVDAVLDRLTDYMGTDDVTAEWAPPPGAEDLAVADRQPWQFRPGEDLLARAYEQIGAGEVWNGLALLRHGLEARLQRLAAGHAVTTPRGGAGALLRHLLNRGVLSEQAARPLGYAIHVATRAIHGEDVSVDQAEEALANAVTGLRMLRDTAPAESA
ncbi:MAG: hypothetical protein M3134_07895 [Actinomycetota bacterium]|nr:hypothetical protein [Actinomycetota bacterium]